MKEHLSEKKIAKTFFLQHDQSDCGVTCLSILIKYYKGNMSLEKLRELSGTNKQGTSLLGLYQAANQVGFSAKGNEAEINDLIEYGEPLILHVAIDNILPHYVICYGYKNDSFIIGDPAKGIYSCSRENLNKIWKSKACLVLSPNDSFKKIKEIKFRKKEWFIDLIKEDYKLLIFSVILGFFSAILGMVMAVFSQKLIDDILPSKDLNKLITGIIVVAFLLLISIVFNNLRAYFLIHQTKDFNIRIIDKFYSSLINLPKPFFDTRKIGELVSRLNDTQRIQKVIKIVINNFVINFLVSIISLGLLFYYSWQIGLIACISLPCYFLLLYNFNSKIIKTQKNVMQSRAHSQSNYISTMDGISTIKNNNKQLLFQKLNKLVYSNYQDQLFLLGKINIRLSLFSGIFGIVFLIAILTITSLKVYYDLLELGELIAILTVSGSLLPSIASLALIAIPINEATVAFNRMYEFTSLEKEKSGFQEINDFKSLSINNLSFRFAGKSELLKKICLNVNKGEFIALVGESGSGKSTLGQIIQKFYLSEKGRILINGEYQLEDLTMDSWRRYIGVIEQDIKIFNSSVIDNIILESQDSTENIINFFEYYGFDKYISEFPQGYYTILGEEGINLSGGQKQIIALARALYKKPQLLILDEYTSAMDRKAEQFSFEILKKLKKEIGVIFISHRLHSLPKIADRIYVIEEGEIEVSGSHNQLLETSNFYSDYWKEFT